jgi:hypothetical protein
VTGWTAAEERVIAAAVERTPTVDGARPWTLELSAGTVAVIERAGGAATVACGAALAAAHLAVRWLGRSADWTWLPAPARPEMAGRVWAGAVRAPSAVERARYRGLLTRRGCPRDPVDFTDEPVDGAVVLAIARAARTACARGHPLVLPPSREGTPSQTSLVVLTDGDHRHDRLEAGMAMLRAWVTAAAAGLACALSTPVPGGPVLPPGVAGHPQVLLRIGYPSDVDSFPQFLVRA